MKKNNAAFAEVSPDQDQGAPNKQVSNARKAEGSSIFEPIPSPKDPRWAVFSLLTLYVVMGITVLNFNRSPLQVLTTVALTCFLDVALNFFLRRRTILFPLSAAISGMGLGILVNYAHGIWPIFIPIFFTVASKYVFTFKGRHIYNPTMFGIVASLLVGQGMISVAPAYQWGGTLAVAAFIVTGALLLFAFKINRGPLIISFLVLYAIQTAFRAWLTRYHVPPETLFLGALSSPAFYLFTFFMITDPATSPRSPRAQVLMSFLIVVLDLVLHTRQMLSTFFFAGIIYATGNLLRLHAVEFIRQHGRYLSQALSGLRSATACACIGFVGIFAYRNVLHPIVGITPAFQFEEISAQHSGIVARPSDLLERVDPKIASIGKWLMSIGDAVAVADVNGDGLPDLFLTLPLKDARDRLALYLNRGNFHFERLAIPVLEDLASDPVSNGLAAGALWFDYDNDADPDLFVSVGWGKSRLLKNLRSETGQVEFEDISAAARVDDYTISIRANAADIDGNGKLDLIVANAMELELPDYAPSERFNIFKLPEPAYSGDRRMLNVMHRTWYDAKNGGPKYLYLNRGPNFERVSEEVTGLTGTRWSLDIGAGDLNADGRPDLYFANDFGPDELFINHGEVRFERVQGNMIGEIGRDTYKGMNASFGDVDGNGFPDIYVSNVHERLQAEGSLLWMNSGAVLSTGADAFTEETYKRNALNEHRFGWGAALGDLDRDGKLDIVQANGHVDDSYDKKYETCQDFWYWNAQIGLTSPSIHGYADSWADIRGRCIFPNELNRVYLNRGDYFVDVAKDVGWTKPGTSRGMALVDLNNDGALDVVVTRMFAPPSIYQMRSVERNWIGLDLEGNGRDCNRDAIGTRVTVRPPAGSTLPSQVREVYAANGLSAQGDHRLLVGLGDAAGPVQFEVNWCGKNPSQVFSVGPNSYYKISQGAAAPLAVKNETLVALSSR